MLVQACALCYRIYTKIPLSVMLLCIRCYFDGVNLYHITMKNSKPGIKTFIILLISSISIGVALCPTETIKKWIYRKSLSLNLHDNYSVMTEHPLIPLSKGHER